jgi:hypothetical protein
MKNILINCQNTNKSKLINLLIYLFIGFIAFSLYYKTLSYDMFGIYEEKFKNVQI